MLPLISLSLFVLCVTLTSSRSTTRIDQLPRSFQSLHHQHRQQAIALSSITAALLIQPQLTYAEDDPSAFYEQRVRSFDSNEYRPGVKGTDVFYPASFNGIWKTQSIFRDVSAPLGIEIFGGRAIFEKTRSDLDTAIDYETAFRRDFNDDELIISDRFENVKKITEASVGSSTSIRSLNSPEEFSSQLQLEIIPKGSPNILDITLLVTDRDFVGTAGSFAMMERVSQIIRIIPNDVKYAALHKDIETITYFRIVDDNHILAHQRTATFLNEKDPRYDLALGRNPSVRNTAIDVRLYDLVYTRETTSS